MINKDEIVNCLKSVVSRIVSMQLSEIREVCQADIFPAEYVIQEISEYPGNISSPSAVMVDEKSLLRINDDELFVYFNLWFDNKESDLTVTVHIKKERDKLSYYIDEVHVH